MDSCGDCLCGGGACTSSAAAFRPCFVTGQVSFPQPQCVVAGGPVVFQPCELPLTLLTHSLGLC
jgi:hypothetical protein